MHNVLQYDCSRIYKKCSPKSYGRDIKYHVTLNIMLSVGSTLTPIVIMLH